MKVLMICTVPLTGNGIAACIENYAASLAPETQVHILGPKGSSDSLRLRLQEHGIALYELPNRKSEMANYFIALWKHLRKEQYDVVHVHGNSATMAVELLAAFLSGVKKRVAHCHTSKCDHVKAHKLLMPLFSRLYTDALACSELAGDWIFGKGKFAVLNNAIETRRYAWDPQIRQSCRQALGMGDEDFVLGHVGHFSESKNQRFLVELMMNLRRESNGKLLLIGEGAMEEEIRLQVETSGLADRVLFLGSRDDIPNLLQAMDLFLFPSKWEGFGIALVEAQLSGLQCIASEHVPQDTNISGAVTYLSLEDQAAWVGLILENGRLPEREARSQAAIQAALEKGFDIHSQAEKLLETYRR